MQKSSTLLLGLAAVGLSLSGLAFANTTLVRTAALHQTGHVKLFHNTADIVNCNYYAYNVCVQNRTQQNLSFNVPAFGIYQAPLPPNQWADAGSNNNYGYNPDFQLIVKNAYGQIIFNQWVANDGLVVISPGLKKALKTQVISA